MFRRGKRQRRSWAAARRSSSVLGRSPRRSVGHQFLSPMSGTRTPRRPWTCSRAQGGHALTPGHTIQERLQPPEPILQAERGDGTSSEKKDRYRPGSTLRPIISSSLACLASSLNCHVGNLQDSILDGI